jgi:hypothetical protein
LLTHCKANNVKRLWVLTSDRDYTENFEKRLFLNSLLRRDLTKACGTGLEVYCFNDLLDGVDNFGASAGVKADKLPSAEEATEIKKEIEGLRPVGWMHGGDNRSLAALMNTQFYRNAVLLDSRGSHGFLTGDQGGGGFFGTSGVAVDEVKDNT